MAYKTIIVGTDGSETAARAVDHASALASAHGSRLVVVTAFQPSDEPPDDRIPADVRWQVTDANEADRRVSDARRQAAEAGVSDVVVQPVPGDPPDVLIQAAEDFNADLLVVGSIGLTGVARILGSVAAAVLHHAPCDVLVAQTDQ